MTFKSLQTNEKEKSYLHNVRWNFYLSLHTKVNILNHLFKQLSMSSKNNIVNRSGLNILCNSENEMRKT